MSRFPTLARLQLMAASLACLATTSCHASDWLFRDGKSNYRIMVSATASASEQTAARELQQYIEQISGAQLPITDDLNARGRRIFVGSGQSRRLKIVLEDLGRLMWIFF